MWQMACHEDDIPEVGDYLVYDIPHLSFLIVRTGYADTILDSSSPCYYNNSIEIVLDGTNPYEGNFLFPLANLSGGDPNFFNTPEPDLSSASSQLGEWLNSPFDLNENWANLQSAPQTWPINSETGIVYQIDAGEMGLSQVVAFMNADNGVYIWLDGEFVFGAVQPGGYSPNPEYNIGLGDLSPGIHYFQVLREDHGHATG